jgi:two-component system chemotaxis sensor kinase CheA
MRIPLTLAIIPALIVRSVNQSFALPQGALLGTGACSPRAGREAAIEWIEGAPLYRLRGKLLPLVFLDRLLMPGAEHKIVTERDNFIAVLDADGPPLRPGGRWAGRSGGDRGQAAERGAQGYWLFSGATVLGNADLALILDPGAIAMKAGVSMSAEEEKRRARPEGETGAEAAKSLEYLLVEAAGRQAAVPLADVLRIEQLPAFAHRVHRLSAGAQLRGATAAGRGFGRRAGRGRGQSRGADHRGGLPRGQSPCGHCGFACAGCGRGGDLFEAGTSQRTGGVTLLKSRVTGVVDLGGVAPLPGKRRPPEWKPDRGDSGMSTAAMAVNRKEK